MFAWIRKNSSMILHVIFFVVVVVCAGWFANSIAPIGGHRGHHGHHVCTEACYHKGV